MSGNADYLCSNILSGSGAMLFCDSGACKEDELEVALSSDEEEDNRPAVTRTQHGTARDLRTSERRRVAF